MWATGKQRRMVSTQEIQMSQMQNGQLPAKVRNTKSIEGRVFILCLATWYFGFVLTEISLITPPIWYVTFGVQMTHEYYVGPCFGMIPLGAAIGVLVAHFTMNKISRKNYLVLLSIANIVITGCLQIGDVQTLFVFRFLQGVLAGIFMNFIPTYISELTPKQFGSKFGVYPQISVVLGVLVAFTVGMIMTNAFGFQELAPTQYDISKENAQVFWRVMLGIPLLPSIIQLISVAIGFIPESPASLLQKNKRDDAREVLSLFYEDEFLSQIVEEKEQQIFEKDNQRVDKKIVWTTKGVYLGFQLAIFQVTTGIASYVTQTGHVVSVSLQQPIFGLYTPILITIAQLIGTLISIPMLKFIKWRTLTIIGGFSLTFFSALNALFFYLQSHTQQFQPYAMTLVMVSIMAFMFTFGITVGSSVWPYISYMMSPNKILASQFVNWFLAGISIMAFSFNINSTSNPWIIITVYTVITFVITILNCVFMVDIKGLTVRKVQMKLAQD